MTALSGSGPAYVFHLLEAMLAAGREMGLGADRGAPPRASRPSPARPRSPPPRSDEPDELRRNVTSPGRHDRTRRWPARIARRQAALVEAILAARDRARELGDEFG